MQDPHYCLDNSGHYANGANIIIWTCKGNSNQRFKFDPATSEIAMRNYPDQVVDASAFHAGANALTWSFEYDSNQLWSMVQ
jgi:hypothetical protein